MAYIIHTGGELTPDDMEQFDEDGNPLLGIQEAAAIWTEKARKEGYERAVKELKSSKAFQNFTDDGRAFYTVQELASLWRRSHDTILRMFQDEPGLLLTPGSNPNPRGKRRRVSFTIPREVMLRVRKKYTSA